MSFPAPGRSTNVSVPGYPDRMPGDPIAWRLTPRQRWILGAPSESADRLAAQMTDLHPLLPRILAGLGVDSVVAARNHLA